VAPIFRPLAGQAFLKNGDIFLKPDFQCRQKCLGYCRGKWQGSASTLRKNGGCGGVLSLRSDCGVWEDEGGYAAQVGRRRRAIPTLEARGALSPHGAVAPSKNKGRAAAPSGAQDSGADAPFLYEGSCAAQVGRQGRSLRNAEVLLGP
jgi:hypothetical protein